MKRIGKVWKDARHDLFHNFYIHTSSLEENIARRPAGIDENHWRLFLEYRLSEKTQERKRGGSISRGELWVMLHKKKNGSYIHDDAQIIGEKIMNIENQDESSKEISKNDSLSQALGKEHSGRVRGVGSRPCPTQLFSQTTHQFGGSSHASVIQSEMNEIKSQLEAKRLKRKNLEEIVEAERMKRVAVESAVKYILQLQGGNLPPELAAMINTVGQDEGSGPISPGARPSSSASHDAQRQSNQSAN